MTSDPQAADPQAAPPQLSPDGRWAWDGQQWLPAPAAEGAPPAEWAPAPAGPAIMTPAFTGQPSAPKHDGLAIASLVLSLIWLMGLGSIAAVVLGHVSRNKAQQEGRPKSGVALAGLILGYLGSAFFVVGIIAAITIPALLSQRESAVRIDVKNELRSAAVAEETYLLENGSYVDVASLSAGTGYTPGKGVAVTLVGATETSFCLAGTKQSVTLFYDSATGTMLDAPCG